MNSLHEAYNALGLEYGALPEAINHRYKRLIMAWHPDRASTIEGKKRAEQESKKLNIAKYTLIQHFRKEHRQLGCACQPASGSNLDSSQTTAGKPDSPCPRVTGGSAGTTDLSPPPPAVVSASVPSYADAEKHEGAGDCSGNTGCTYDRSRFSGNDNVLKLRTKSPLAISLDWLQRCPCIWKVTGFLLLASVISSILGPVAPQRNKQPHTYLLPNDTQYPPQSYRQSYRQSYDENQSESVQQRIREQKRHDENLYFTRLDIDTWHRTIESCNADIAQLELKIADLTISETEKQRLALIREQRRRNLADAQENLESAQRQLDVLKLEGTPEQVH